MPPTRGFARALDGDRRAGGDRRDQAPVAVEGRRSNVDLDPADVAARVRGRRGGVPVGAHRRGVLRRLGRRPRASPATSAALPVLRKDFTVVAARRRRRPADGRRLRAADRRRARPRSSWSSSTSWPTDARPRRARRGPRRARARGRPRVRGDARRRQPARPRHVRGRPRAGRRGWPRAIPDGVVEGRRVRRPRPRRRPAPRRRRLRRHPRRRDARDGGRPGRRRCATCSASDRRRRTRSARTNRPARRARPVPFAPACS